MSFIKLQDLDGKQFTVKSSAKFQWKKWDNAQRKMLTSDQYEEGYSKRYPISTDAGDLELSNKQMSDMLSGVVFDGVADINNKTFKVKRVVSGTGANERITYYINPVWDKAEPVAAENVKLDNPLPEISDEPINLEDIPF